MKKCKITVLKRNFDEELAEKYAPLPIVPCKIFAEGEEYITKGYLGSDMPDGFCSIAWNDIYPYVQTLLSGGEVFGVDNKQIACCTDGLRPVVFEIDVIEDDEPKRADMYIKTE